MWYGQSMASHRETVEACIRIVERWVWEGDLEVCDECGSVVYLDSGKATALRELRGYADDADHDLHLRG